jgi:N-acetyl-anhydromuramyl-L-alanine amidase AmpD
MISLEKLYTARWHSKEISRLTTEERIKTLADKQYEVLTEMIGDDFSTPQVEEPERPNPQELGKKMLWYPKAEVTAEKMPTRGQYANKYPVGAVVHFTAGRSLKGDADALNAVRLGVSNGFCYFAISNDGTVFQSFPLDRWGYHCGASSWPSLGTSLSNKLVGIEICCAGKLSPSGESWFGESYPESSQRQSLNVANIEAGNYHRYTPAQEKSLIELLMWLKLNNPGVFQIDNALGHDEISPKRKNDPGASLSMTMPELRKLLKNQLAGV